jgi:hypothetical protein
MTATARARTPCEPATTALAAAGVSRVATWLSIAALAALLALRLLAGWFALAMPRALLLALTAGTAIVIASAIVTRLAASLALAAM